MHIKSLPLFILISSSLLNAQVVPGRWEKVDSLRSGERIVVTLKAGGLGRFSLKESDADDVTVVTSTGRELKIAKTEVRSIVGEKTVIGLDGTLKGAVAGFAVGALIAGIILGAIANNEGGWSSTTTAHVLGYGAAGAGIGAAVGFGVDISQKHRRTEVLYRASP